MAIESIFTEEDNAAIECIRERKCPKCQEPWVNAFDNISEMISPYLWEPTCECYPDNMRIAMG